MTTEEKFRAAVNVIRSLPKNGSYQPSHDLMLRFYGYFKQATEGPCHASRPAFWEVVRKMKWDAWNRLGNMPREEAMNNYVEELKKIVETMSYTENVADFLGSLDSFYDSVPVEDLELLVGNVIERMRSQPGSPLSRSPIGSREASPHRVQGTLGHITSSLETSPASSYSASPLPPDEDDDEDEFIDTVETEPENNKEGGKPLMNGITNGMTNGITNGMMNGVTNGGIKGVLKKPLQSIQHAHMNGGIRKSIEEPPMMNSLTNGHGKGHSNGYSNGIHEEELLANDRSRPRERGSPRMRPRHDGKLNEISHPPTKQQPILDISDQIRDTVLHLQRDLDRVTSRVRSLEVSALSCNAHFAAQARPRHPKWWPLTDISPSAFLFLAAWPFIAHGLIIWLQRRRALRH